MCGIVATTGGTESLGVLLAGLERLEYRGYDSAGVALHGENRLWRRRAEGRLANLRGSLEGAPASGAGIGHTRWATHGAPSLRNAHPHLDCGEAVAVVHNGIVENHSELRHQLQESGHTFTSETDTEVIVHALEESLKTGLSLRGAVQELLPRLEGSFALAAMHRGEPEKVVVARRGSPLVVGREGALVVAASDIPAILERTRHVHVLPEDTVAEMLSGSVTFWDERGEVEVDLTLVEWDAAAAQRGEWPDYMAKEIAEQPEAARRTLEGGARELAREDHQLEAAARSTDRLVIVACGTSYHAGRMVRGALEELTGMAVEVEIASEFRYRRITGSTPLVVAVSQSGETLDTLEAVKHGTENGAYTVAVTNVQGSALERATDTALHTHAGPETSVAATKTHTSQVAMLLALGHRLAEARGSAKEKDELKRIPDTLAAAVERTAAYTRAGARLAEADDLYYLGRGVGVAVAMEGALKLKEIGYVRAEAYPAGEMKHGPIALVEKGSVVVGVLLGGALHQKMLANVAEMRARGATVVLVAPDGDPDAAEEADTVLWIPKAEGDVEQGLAATVALQALARGFALERGLDVDRPRNLAKTVTVE